MKRLTVVATIFMPLHVDVGHIRHELRRTCSSSPGATGTSQRSSRSWPLIASGMTAILQEEGLVVERATRAGRQPSGPITPRRLLGREHDHGPAAAARPVLLRALVLSGAGNDAARVHPLRRRRVDGLARRQIARRTGTVTAIGKAIDPLVDRLLIAFGVLGLYCSTASRCGSSSCSSRATSTCSTARGCSSGTGCGCR